MTITIDRAVAQQALEALEGLSEPYYVLKAQDALRAALEQPEQEPVASIYVTIGGDREFDDWRCPLPVGGNLLYTHPPRREWRGLSKDESLKMWGMRSDGPSNLEIIGFARAIEAALRSKNYE